MSLPVIEPISPAQLQRLQALQTSADVPESEQYQIAGSASRATVPFHAIHANSVQVNGIRASLFFDTGSPGTMIPADVAIRANVPLTSDPPEKDRFPWGEVTVYRAILPSLKIGSLEIKNVPVGVLADKVIFKLGGIFPLSNFGGLVGLDVMKHFALQLDLGHDKLTLIRPTSETKAVLQGLPSVPFELVKEKITVRATIEGQGPYQLFIDTGAGINRVIVSEKVGQDLKIPQIATDVKMILSKKSSFSIRSFQLGPIEFHDLVGVAISKEIPLSEFDGVIATEIFKGYTLIFDFTDNKLYLKNLGAK